MCDCRYKEKGGSTWSYKDRSTWDETYQKYQSIYKTPINIETPYTEKIINDNLKINWSSQQKLLSYENSNFIQYNPVGEVESHVLYKGKKYYLANIHFHSGAENTVDNLYYPMEAHAVHSYVNVKTKEVENLVIGMHFKLIEDNNPQERSLLTKNLINNYGKEVVLDLSVYNNLTQNNFHRWLGTLTTPPFSENIIFNLFSPSDVTNIPLGIRNSDIINYNIFFGDSRDLITDQYKLNRRFNSDSKNKNILVVNKILKTNN